MAALEGDKALRATLGEEFIRLFLAVKRHEIAKAKAAIPEYDSPGFSTMVSEWEWGEYFEFLQGRRASSATQGQLTPSE